MDPQRVEAGAGANRHAAERSLVTSDRRLVRFLRYHGAGGPGGLVGDPVVEEERTAWQVVSRITQAQAQQLSRLTRQDVVRGKFGRDIGELGRLDFGRVHRLDPAKDPGCAQLHQRGRVGVPRQVTEERPHQGEVGNAGPASKEVGGRGEVGLEQVQRIGVDRLQRRKYRFGDANALALPLHAVRDDPAVVIEILVTALGLEGTPELATDEAVVLLHEVPAVVPGRLCQQAIDEHLEQAGHQLLPRARRIDRGLRVNRLERVQDRHRILDHAAVGELQLRDAMAAGRRSDVLSKTRMGGQALDERDALLPQIAASPRRHVGRVGAVEKTRVTHGLTLPQRLPSGRTPRAAAGWLAHGRLRSTRCSVS